MFEVKISSRGAGSNRNLSQFLGNLENIYGDCRFHVNSHIEEADVWFVSEDIDDDDQQCSIPPGNLFFLTSETSWPAAHYSDSAARLGFIKQFSRQFTCHDLYLPTTTYTLPFLPWMINANHGESILAPHERDVRFFESLTSLPKDRMISVFCSAQTMTPNHRMRLRFVEQLKSHFGDTLHWYGNGVQSVAEKWEGLAPYKYTIVLENQSSNNVITEKIQDAFLGLSYPIYWGAPNINDHFSHQSLTSIDIKDFPSSVQAIERILSEDPYDEALSWMLASKQTVLNELHFLKRLAAITLETCEGRSGEDKQTVRVLPASEFSELQKFRIGRTVERAGRLIERSGRRISF